MAVVKGDDKIEKIAPLIIPAAFATVGALQGAGFRFHDDEGKFDPNFGGRAKAVDPLTGGMIAERDLGDSTGDKVLGGAIGATQGLNPLTWLRPLAWAGKGAKALRAKRAADVVEAGDTAADAYRAAQLADINRKIEAIDAMPAGADDAYRFVGGGVDTTGATSAASRGVREIDYLADLARQDEIARLQGLGTTASGTTQPHLRARYLAGEGTLAGTEGVGRLSDLVSRPHLPYMRAPTRAGRLKRDTQFLNLTRAQQNAIRARQGARVGQGTAIHGPAIAGIGAYLGQKLADQAGATDDVNIAPVNQGVGGTALSHGGMTDMSGQTHGVNEQRTVWNLEGNPLHQPNHTPNQTTHSASTHHGANTVLAGENMTIGEQLLKEAKEDMDKEKSPKGKGKGMILIIGHGGKKSDKDDEKDSPC